MSGRPDLEACIGDSCITCGDIALELVVLTVDGDESRCRTADGLIEMVATELVQPIAPGDRVLVHAGVAIAKLAPYETTGGEQSA